MAKKVAKKLSSISDLRSKYGRPETQYKSTGILAFDDLWGGGCPSGKVIELHSDAGLGKTTILLQMAKAFMKSGIKVGFMDVEQALDLSLLASMKMEGYTEPDPSNGEPLLSILAPATFDEVQEVMDYFIDAGYHHIIYDSLTMTSPDRVETRKFSEEDPGLKSRMQAKLLERYKPIIARTQGNLFLVNQMRANLGSFMGGQMPAGGAALRFYTDIRTGMKRLRWVQRPDENGEKVNVGAELQVTTIKNKVAIPFRTCNVILEFGKGVNPVTSLTEALLAKKIITTTGAYFQIPGVEEKVHGRAKLEAWVKANFAHCRDNFLHGDLTDDATDSEGGSHV